VDTACPPHWERGCRRAPQPARRAPSLPRRPRPPPPANRGPSANRLDLVKIACGLQLASAALLFYSCELGLHLDVGDSFRAVSGLGLGYFARIFIPIEQLVRPGGSAVLAGGWRGFCRRAGLAAEAAS
jgi:hypothetical protein